MPRARAQKWCEDRCRVRTKSLRQAERVATARRQNPLDAAEVMQAAAPLGVPDTVELLRRLPMKVLRSAWRPLVLDALIDAGYQRGSLAFVDAILRTVQERYEARTDAAPTPPTGPSWSCARPPR